MTKWTSSGTTQIPDEGIKKHFRSYEPCDSLIELVWNGLDAKANRVSVTLHETEAGAVTDISILDDGDGIDFLNIDDNFGKFNDSAKKEDFSQHGSHGRGRLAFHRICHDAIWYTKRENGKQARIHVTSEKLRNWDGEELDNSDQHQLLTDKPRGTCVELKNFHENLPDIDNIRKIFGEEFGWRLVLDPHRNILVNDQNISIPEHFTSKKKCEVKSKEFQVTVIQWKKKPLSEKSYIYLLNSDNTLIFRTLSGFNYKNDFYVSVIVHSKFADEFSINGGDLESGNKYTEHSPEWSEFRAWLADYVSTLYKEFLIRNADIKISEYERQNVFPTYENLKKEDAEWRLENTKNIVRALYMAEPALVNKLNIKQKKILFAILDRIAISSENDCLFDVLQSILDLNGDSLEMFAGQIKKSHLENIIRTIEALQRRQEVIHMMKYIMDDRYREVLETPDLQGIIEANTWLFGEQYLTIGAEEDSIKQLALSVRSKVSDIASVTTQDCEGLDEIEGILKQPDLFLCGKNITQDSAGNRIIKYTLIEIKRPGIALNKKHLAQLEEYAEIIQKTQQFTGHQMHVDCILAGRKISSDDVQIKSRRESMIGKGTFGFIGQIGNARMYVLDWTTLLANFEISNDFLLSQLKMKRNSYSECSTNEIITNLQKGSH